MNEREIVIHAFLCADRVITEDNGKKGLIGVFNRFHFPGFPVQSPPWFVFVSLENVAGRNEFTVNLAHRDSQGVVFSAGGTFEVRDASASVELPLPVPGVRFNKPGAYILTFILNGRETASRIIQVSEIER